MYSFLHELLSDKKGSEIFTLFGFWHFFYIALTLSTVVLLLLCLKKKDLAVKVKTAKVFGDLAFGLYIADIFLMPLAYGEIDIEKLPFHACTAMCVACFLSYRIKFLEKFRTSFVILGFISNLVYLIYPAGVMWHAVHPLSYRVVQTLIFHGVMTVYGALSLIYESDNSVKLRRDLTVTVCMTLWAMLGNYAYNGESDGYSHFFNWFFVVRDPFYALDEKIAPFIMPLLNIALFFAVELIIRLLIKISKGETENEGKTCL
jgi:hypothetical protein